MSKKKLHLIPGGIVWDIHSDTMAPWIFIGGGLVAGIVLVAWLKRGPRQNEPFGLKVLVALVLCIGGIVGGGWWSYSTEQTLDNRDNYIEAQLKRRGIELLEVDGNHADVKVRRGECTAWFEIKGGTYGPDQSRHEWPLAGHPRQLTSGCSEGDFAPK